MELLKLVGGVRQDHEQHTKEIKEMEQRLESQLQMYVRHKDFNDVVAGLCTKAELGAVQKLLQPLVRAEDVKVQFNKQSEAIKQVSQRIGETLATKQDLLKFEQKITKYANDTFISQQENKRQDLNSKKQVDKLEKFADSIQSKIDNIEMISRQLKSSMHQKADIQEVMQIGA